MQRYFFSGASEAELDKQGRVIDPGGARSSTASSAARSSSPASATTSRSGTAPPGASSSTEVEGSAEDVAERLAAQRD